MSTDLIQDTGQNTEQGAGTSGKVLIVDDEASVRRALHITLLSAGFDVGEASSGEEAIALCQIIKYDAVLLDLNMQGKSGIETFIELRKSRPRLAILMLSVTDDFERKAQALESGADDYVTKPFHVRELSARIRAALRRAQTPAAASDEVIAIGDSDSASGAPSGSKGRSYSAHDSQGIRPASLPDVASRVADCTLPPAARGVGRGVFKSGGVSQVVRAPLAKETG